MLDPGPGGWGRKDPSLDGRQEPAEAAAGRQEDNSQAASEREGFHMAAPAVAAAGRGRGRRPGGGRGAGRGASASGLGRAPGRGRAVVRAGAAGLPEMPDIDDGEEAAETEEPRARRVNTAAGTGQMLVIVPPHPLIGHWLGVARNKEAPPPVFRNCMSELGRLLIYEAVRDLLPTRQGEIETPVGLADVEIVDPTKPVKVRVRVWPRRFPLPPPPSAGAPVVPFEAGSRPATGV